MSAQAEFMARARRLGACHECCYVRDEPEVRRVHPECHSAILHAMHERYGDVPTGQLRRRLYEDGVR